MRTCMGGWCTQRERCQRYQPGMGWKPSDERLCSRGGQEHFIPLVPIPAALANIKRLTPYGNAGRPL